MMTLIMDCNVSTEVKYYSNEENGTQVAHFNVAYNLGKDKEAIFFPATVFGRNAYNASKYIKKGMPLLLRCQLKPVAYNKKDSDVEVRTFELIIQEFKMLSSGGTSGVAENSGGTEKESKLPDDIIE